MWHSAQFRGDELIVLGHDPRRNDCMLVRLSGLPMNEQHDLRRIAASRSAQESSHLIPILRRVTAPDGGDWFTYLAAKMQQRNSPVFTLPIKEIQDSLDADQKAIFKGYGKGRRNTGFERDELGRAQAGEIEELEDLPEMRNGAKAPVNNSEDDKIDLLIETITDENRRTQQLLNKLLKALSAEPEPKRVPKPRKATRPSTKHVVPEEVAEAYES